jgi:hypothetical protein
MCLRLLIVIFTMLMSCPIWANTSDTTFTQYENGEYTTVSVKRVKASNTAAINAVQDLVEQFENEPSKLFDWALKDLGFQGQKDKELILNLKSATFDKKTGITHGLVDVIVPGITSFKDIKVDAIVEAKTSATGVTKAIADVLYSDMLLKKAYGQIFVVPHRGNEVVITSILKTKFGWFFNIFITQKRYKSIIEWRVKKFTENMCEASMENGKRKKAIPQTKK